MKTTKSQSVLLFILLILTTISCKKEIQSKPENAHVIQNNQVEVLFQKFIENKLTIDLSIFGGPGIGGPPSVQHQSYSYKLSPGMMYNNKYYYKLNKYVYHHGCGGLQTIFHEEPWVEIGFYRYDYLTKKAYLYDDLQDLSPKLLMDFNVSIGDTIYLNNDSQIKFIVDNYETELIENIPFPLIEGRLIQFNGQQCNFNNCDVTFATSTLNQNKFTLSCYTPNFINIDLDINSIINTDWEDSNFCYYNYGGGIQVSYIQSISFISSPKENPYLLDSSFNYVRTYFF